MHKRIHIGEKAYHCDICGKSFSSCVHLSTHKYIHTGERPYHCDICGKSFSQSNDLKKHKPIHTGERKYHCDICGKPFIQQSAVSIHKRIHTGERQYHCDVCGKSFSQSTDFKRHKHIQTGEKGKGPSNNQEELFDKILSGHFEFISPFWDEVSSSAKDLIEHMLQVDPEMRFSAAEVLDHPWVANDTAKDNKLHVAKELNQYFTRTKKPKDGLAVIAVSEKFFK
ncbi:serine/threonine-protein kinase DCLK1-like [Octopus vulgaris]|uniref:Serine/threonine-protein kinase DCLK1-like n=1 Tax=Octopus vulgaris TaxID=6645 RepID=A0AA36MJ01_OCTVU|nr:serine/threonine-protein kinase DCLK1-like [Octopus vulgaris]